MAQDIVPIGLGLPQGDLVTLWAPRWREDGEEWEAFLGSDDKLYGFPDVAQLAAFIRGKAEHDLTDHPAWRVIPTLSAGELVPDDDYQFDLVGVPELVAEDPDTWVVGELADTIAMVRSIAEVCELDKVIEVLDSAEGFDLLGQGLLPFTGRDGERRWTKLADAIVEHWDEVLDAIDELITTPEVDKAAVAAAEHELVDEVSAEADPDEDETVEVPEVPAAPMGFWGEVGIDPIKIVLDGDEYYTLRCYVADKPVFLGSDEMIDVFPSAKALTRFLSKSAAEIQGTELAEVSTWPEVTAKAETGELKVEVDEENVYVFDGLVEDIAQGPSDIDPTQLDLAVELLTDAAEWAQDDTVTTALAQSESLGWLVSFVLRPDPTRLAPSEPFDTEVALWQELVDSFQERLRTR